MLAELLNTQFGGYEAWKILLAVALVGVVTILGWVACIVAAWRSDMPRNTKVIVCCIIIALGPVSFLTALVTYPLQLPLDLIDWMIRQRRRSASTSHSRRISR